MAIDSLHSDSLSSALPNDGSEYEERYFADKDQELLAQLADGDHEEHAVEWLERSRRHLVSATATNRCHSRR